MSGMKHLLTASAILTILTAQAQAQWTETIYSIDSTPIIRSKATTAVNNTGSTQTLNYNQVLCHYVEKVIASGYTGTPGPSWRSEFATLRDFTDNIVVYAGSYSVPANSTLYLLFNFSQEQGQNSFLNSEEFFYASRSRTWETWIPPFEYGYMPNP